MNIFYHITSAKNLESILSNGLTAKGGIYLTRDKNMLDSVIRFSENPLFVEAEINYAVLSAENPIGDIIVPDYTAEDHEINKYLNNPNFFNIFKKYVLNRVPDANPVLVKNSYTLYKNYIKQDMLERIEYNKLKRELKNTKKEYIKKKYYTN